jgi:hypothetical protein
MEHAPINQAVRKEISRISFIRPLVSMRTTVICLLILVILVLWGTLYQVNNGLFAAKERFFNAWFLLLGGFVPFPAVRLTIATLIVNLISQLLLTVRWSWRQSGAILLHLGVLTLLVGGAYVSFTARESYLALWEGESSREAACYDRWELAVCKKGGANREAGQERFDLRELQAGTALGSLLLPHGTAVQSILSHATALTAGSESASGGTIDSLAPLPALRDPARNIPGLILCAPSAAARVLLFGANPQPSELPSGADTLLLSLRNRRVALPLTITLIDFKKEEYAGTAMARGFSSLIHVKGDDIDRDVLIAMNKPFRYRDFALYQSSYAQDGRRESSTLAVVQSAGKSLPYLASLLMAFGLALHLIVKLFTHARARRG